MTPRDRLPPSVGPLGLTLTALVWLIFLYLQRGLPLPSLRLSPGWHWAMTLIFAVDGIATVAWSLGSLAAARRAGALARKGPYAVVRHPMYSAVMYSGTAAVAFAFQAWVVLLAALPLHLIWVRLAQKEEQTLAGRFGDEYLRYAAATGPFLPRLRQLTRPPGDSPELPG